MPRLTADQWTAAEADVRAGRGTLRAIAARYGCTEGALRKRMKTRGIEVDLAKEVKAETERRLLEPEVRKVRKGDKVRTANVRTDEQIVADAAAEREGVVRTHRRDIRQARSLVSLLWQQAQEVAENRGAALGLVEALKDPKNPAATAAMRKAVSIPGHAGTVRDLSTAMKNLVALERQAFNLGEKSEDDGIEAWLKRLEGE